MVSEYSYKFIYRLHHTEFNADLFSREIWFISLSVFFFSFWFVRKWPFRSVRVFLKPNILIKVHTETRLLKPKKGFKKTDFCASFDSLRSMWMFVSPLLPFNWQCQQFQQFCLIFCSVLTALTKKQTDNKSSGKWKKNGEKWTHLKCFFYISLASKWCSK